jgi:hypothetical protein
MQDDESKRPTNGDTDGDGPDTYRKAAVEHSLQLAALAKVVLRRSHDLVEAAMYAIPLLSGLHRPTEEGCCARYTWQLADTSQEISHHSSKVAEAAKDLLPVEFLHLRSDFWPCAPLPPWGRGATVPAFCSAGAGREITCAARRRSQVQHNQVTRTRLDE